ncbi:hypothetical protein CVT24_003324 [Panaeolus cyanescens]|uniref:Uncharacterized protein n=1 Tax=Panaeolus cyanescens TaxID=181874 RepID=A0A409WT91_9AGAR|nr:hypothetical protein CVT24_003324 [Panaeolus cyanescens]
MSTQFTDQTCVITPTLERSNSFTVLRDDKRTPFFSLLTGFFKLSSPSLPFWPKENITEFIGLVVDLGITFLKLYNECLAISANPAHRREQYVQLVGACKGIMLQISEFFDEPDDLIKFEDMIDIFLDHVAKFESVTPSQSPSIPGIHMLELPATSEYSTAPSIPSS